MIYTHIKKMSSNSPKYQKESSRFGTSSIKTQSDSMTFTEMPSYTSLPENWSASQHPLLKNNVSVIQTKTNDEDSFPNHTGMPDHLKAGLEHLSGMDLSDVRVHRNSNKPSQVQALAYTQGTNIYLGPGQEKHLPHEGWHVVQQMAGRVKPTMQKMAGGGSINDDAKLEREADVMGAKSSRGTFNHHELTNERPREGHWYRSVSQLKPKDIITKIANYQEIALSEAKEILKNDFYSNWFVAKEYLLEDKHCSQKTLCEQLMKTFIKLRSDETERLLEYIRDEILVKQKEFKALTPDGRLKWGSAGSETLTSDIDVNLKGAGSILAVTYFNQKFKTGIGGGRRGGEPYELGGWTYDPGTVYDVNVYAQDFMETKPFNLRPNNYKTTARLIKTTARLIPQQEVIFPKELFAVFSTNQDVWSLVKMRTYMTEKEWQTYRSSIVGDTLDPNEVQFQTGKGDKYEDEWVRKQQLRETFADAEYYYKQSQTLLKQKIQELENSSDYTMMQEQLEQNKEDLGEHRVYDTKKMMAANLIYQEKLNKVAQIRQELKQESQLLKKQESGIHIKNALSHALIYANEAYLTQGAVHFSVIGQQIGPKIKQNQELKGINLELTEQEYLHSFREQVGDTLKVLDEYRDAPLWTAIYKAGKYIDRMIKSAIPLIETLPVPWFNELRNAGEKAMALKANKASSETQQSELEPIVNVWVEQNYSIPQFRQLIIQFGSDVEKMHKISHKLLDEYAPSTKLFKVDDKINT